MEPTVKLISMTPMAVELLIYTKSSRLDAGTTMDEIFSWPESKKMEHIDYMMKTIKGSFEFVDYVFEIKGVSRAFTHQLVRTRTASFQQQSQRTVNASSFDFLETTDHEAYKDACENSLINYAIMVDDGVPVQDARGVLPTAIHTEIMMKANLRTLHDMAKLRLCKRTQGEYQDVFKMMVKKILEIHPWAEPLLQPHCVSLGVCAFPRYTKCPVQKFCLNPEDVRDKIKAVWSKSKHVANPVAKDGMTM